MKNSSRQAINGHFELNETKMRFSRFLVLFSVNTALGMLPVVCLCYPIFELIAIFQSLFLEFQSDEKQFVEMLKMLQGLDAILLRNNHESLKS